MGTSIVSIWRISKLREIQFKWLAQRCTASKLFNGEGNNTMGNTYIMQDKKWFDTTTTLSVWQNYGAKPERKYMWVGEVRQGQSRQQERSSGTRWHNVRRGKQPLTYRKCGPTQQGLDLCWNEHFCQTSTWNNASLFPQRIKTKTRTLCNHIWTQTKQEHCPNDKNDQILF
jgi:hypothetical protein